MNTQVITLTKEEKKANILDKIKSFWKIVVVSFDTLMVVLRMSKLIINPNDVSPIFKMKAFRNHKSFKYALESLHSDPETHDLIVSRYLAPKAHMPEDLIKYPAGTLGHEFAQFMLKYKLSAVFYPPLEGEIDDDINYLRLRARQTHDIHHFVLGYPPVATGEVAISGFYLAQNKIPLSAFIIGVGFFVMILKHPNKCDDMVNGLVRGWQTGKSASRKFLGVKWEDYFNTPIEEVRKIMNVEVPETTTTKIS